MITIKFCRKTGKILSETFEPSPNDLSFEEGCKAMADIKLRGMIESGLLDKMLSANAK